MFDKGSDIFEEFSLEVHCNMEDLFLILMRIRKARKNLANFSDLMLKKVINVRSLIFKICLFKDLMVD
jgi:hypothetical protein